MKENYDLTKKHRLILRLLEHKSVVSAEELSLSLKLSRRTVYRHIDCLKDHGVNIQYKRSLMGYVLDNTEE